MAYYGYQYYGSSSYGGNGAGSYTKTTPYIGTYNNSYYHYERQYDSSDGEIYKHYSINGYDSKSYYIPQQKIYTLSNSYGNPLDAYSSFSYNLNVNGEYGYRNSTYHYNSGRIFGYVFVDYSNYNSYQYDVGNYNKITYFSHDEGYYYSNHAGQQGVFPYSTFYYQTYFTPVSAYYSPVYSYYGPGYGYYYSTSN